MNKTCCFEVSYDVQGIRVIARDFFYRRGSESSRRSEREHKHEKGRRKRREKSYGSFYPEGFSGEGQVGLGDPRLGEPGWDPGVGQAGVLGFGCLEPEAFFYL